MSLTARRAPFCPNAPGAAERDGVCRGGAPCGRGPSPQGAADARGPAHLLWPPLEPHHLDAELAGAQQIVPHVQQEASAGRGRRLC